MSLHHQNWMDWMEPKLIKMNTRAGWSNYYADGNFLFSQEQHEFFFFFDHKMHHCKNFSPWRNSPDGSSFPRNFRLYQCSTDGVRHNPVSTVITFLTALKAQSAQSFHRYFISYRNCISEHVWREMSWAYLPQGAKAASNESARHVSSSILHLSTVPSATDPSGGVWGRRMSVPPS